MAKYSTDASATEANNEQVLAREPELEEYYGNLKNYIKMVVSGHSNMLMLDAKGGLGKSFQVRETLSEHLEEGEEWTHLKGFTTPVELYKTLWKARGAGHILFLDDMSGITSNTKAIDMLKAATDTNGSENWVEYRSSRGIDHPYIEGEDLPQTFNFRGRIIISFNETPDNRHFNALRDRGTYYNLSFNYEERLDLIKEIAKSASISPLSVEKQEEVAEWIGEVTDCSMEVTIRTFEEVCQMRDYGETYDESWEKMGLEVFDIDWEKHLIIKMRENSDMPIEEQVERFKEETGKSESYYYQLLSDIRDQRMS